MDTICVTCNQSMARWVWYIRIKPVVSIKRDAPNAT